LREISVKYHQNELRALMDNESVSLRSTPLEGMACTYAEIKAGTDLAPAFRGLPDDACQVPHWGYLLKGAIRICYTDGHEELLRPGELFYLPPGHVPVFDEDSAFVEFSPQRDYAELLAHLGVRA
jgi:hypothetical protein